MSWIVLLKSGAGQLIVESSQKKLTKSCPLADESCFFRRSHVVFLDNISRYLIVQDISQQMELVNIYHSKTLKGTPIKFFNITINSVHFKCLQIVRGIYGEVT